MYRLPSSAKTRIVVATAALYLCPSAFADEPTIKLRCYPETTYHSGLIDHSTIADIVITANTMTVVRTMEDGSQTEQRHVGDFETSLMDNADAVWSEQVKNFPSSILSGAVTDLSTARPVYEERATDPRDNGEAVLIASKYCDSASYKGDWSELYVKAARSGH
jgi:hypothetical protein